MFWKRTRKTYRLSDVDKNIHSLADLKNKYVVLIIDDEQFDIIDVLRSNGFRVDHWRDIESVDAAAKYPIVACDISGIGKKLSPGSPSGGIHVLRELKKHYPDKYLIQYSTKNPGLDRKLTSADIIYPKDNPVDAWQEDIERSLAQLGNPKSRWLRIRRRLSDEGVDALEIYNLEQAFIKEVLGSEFGMEKVAKESSLTPELKTMVVTFVTTVVSEAFKASLS